MSDQNKTYIERTSGLKLKDYAGYAMIDTAGCLVFALVTTLLQKFYTDIFHLSPLFIMIMFIIARVWDGINDPIMGRIADTVKPGKFGRYRKWVLYASPFLTLSAVLMFLKFPGIGEEGHYVATCVYATCTYIFFGMAYTVLQIPYGSLASVVTTDAHERSRLSVWRSIGAALGSIPVLLIASFAYADRLDASGNPVIGENGKVITDMQYAPVIKGVIIMAICSFVMLIIAFLLNKERVKTKPQLPQKGATKKALKLLFKNRAFVAITMVSMLLLAGQMFTQSFYTYLFDDYFHANWMNLVSGIGLTTLVMQLWAMIADAIDDIEVKTGSRDDGTAYSVFNLFRKVGQVIAAICVNGALLGMHYKYEKGAVQTLGNLKVMYDLGTLIPAIMFGIMALILFVYYPLTKKKTEELQVQKEHKLRESYEKNEIEI